MIRDLNNYNISEKQEIKQNTKSYENKSNFKINNNINNNKFIKEDIFSDKNLEISTKNQNKIIIIIQII